jgi:HEAT repeat protein
LTRRKNPDQFDLFAPPPAEGTTAPAPAPPPIPRPARAPESLPGEAVLDLLALHLYGVPPDEPALLDLLAEAGRRGDRAAVPLLLRACRRFADRGLDAPPAELAAALDALAALGAAEAAEPVAGLVEAGLLGPGGTAAAAGLLAALRHRPSARLVPALVRDPDPGLREAACRLAGALGRPEDLDLVLGLASDPDRRVARVACLTLGRLGHRPVKPDLEALLVRAAPLDLPQVVEALLPVADADTAVVLGRVAERSDERGRAAIADALGALDAAGAVPVLARLARDAKPGVRLAATAALARHEPDDRTGAALGALARDPDPEVRAAAEEALKAFEADW